MKRMYEHTRYLVPPSLHTLLAATDTAALPPFARTAVRSNGAIRPLNLIIPPAPLYAVYMIMWINNQLRCFRKTRGSCLSTAVIQTLIVPLLYLFVLVFLDPNPKCSSIKHIRACWHTYFPGKSGMPNRREWVHTGLAGWLATSFDINYY